MELKFNERERWDTDKQGCMGDDNHLQLGTQADDSIWDTLLLENEAWVANPSRLCPCVPALPRQGDSLSRFPLPPSAR